MDWLKRNPVFYAILAGIVCTVFVCLWYMSKQGAVLRDLEFEYRAKSKEFDLFLNRKPAPTRGNLEALEGNYAELYSLYERTQVALSLNTFDEKAFFGEVPASKTDSFFEIARYIEGARSLAAKEDVEFAEGERFGFQTYANVGPDQNDIPAVHRQVKIMEFLVQSAIGSGIRKFVSIRREIPNVDKAASNADTFAVNDIFKLDASDETRVKGMIDSDAFRIKFQSQSLGLRNFLNQVVNSSLPFVVCTIEANTTIVQGENTERTVIANSPFLNPDEGNRLMQAAQIPIIAENESEFTVTIEFLKNAKVFELPDSWKEDTDA